MILDCRVEWHDVRGGRLYPRVGGGVRVLSARSMDGVELGASRMLTPLLT